MTLAGTFKGRQPGDLASTVTDEIATEAVNDLVEPDRHGRRNYFEPSPSDLITFSVISIFGLK